MTAYHKPSDFRIGTEFFGAVSFTHFKVINIYHKVVKTKAGKKLSKKRMFPIRIKKQRKSIVPI